MRVAALDLGTNTILCLVVEIENNTITKVLSDQAQVVRLGQGVHQSRKFHEEALIRAEECLSAYAATIKKFNVDKIVAAATSAARDVQNRDDLLAIGARHGIPIEIISGDREAECTYWGTLSAEPVGSDQETIGIIDVGGGSTEFIVGDKVGIQKKISIDVGAVRMTEMFVTQHPIPDLELSKMDSHIEQSFLNIRRLFGDRRISKVIAVAGTPTTIAALDQGQPFDADSVQGYQLPVARLKSWVKRLAQMSVHERQALTGMDPKRADAIVAGALVLQKASEALLAKNLVVSVRGLRYGLALLAASDAKAKELKASRT